MLWTKVRVLEASQAVVEVAANLQFSETVAMKFRGTFVCEKREGRWWIVNLHGSLPARPDPEEVWPVDELRVRNEELEREVAARTAELAVRNEALQKAHHETQIEAALERVRARAMAMQRSEELREVVAVVFEAFQRLDFDAPACSIGIFDEATRSSEWWVASASEVMMPRSYRIPYLEGWPKDWYQTVYDNWQQGVPFFACSFDGEDKRFFDHKILSETEFGLTSDSHVEDIVPLENIILSYAPLTHGVVELGTTKPISEDQVDVLQRFARVIDLTYTRFDDLQQAEARTREAQIETALERVRSKAMAMHSSQDLSGTVNVFFSELKKLGVTPIRCGVAEVDEQTRSWTLAVTNATQQGDSFELLGELKNLDHPVLDNIYTHWERQEEYYPTLQGPDIKPYYQVLRPQLAVPDFPDDSVHHGNYFYFKEGFVFAWTESQLSGEEVDIFRRFTSVLSLTYRRYMDLKEAEARVREATRQASLDRVRAEIASMRTTDDLRRITPLLWRELTTLGVPFFRCGVFIIDERTERIRAYLTNPKGEALAALALPFDSADTTLEAVAHWRAQQVYADVWERETFLAWTRSMMAEGHIQPTALYEEPPEHLALQFVPFRQGMLYVGSSEPLSPEQIDLVQSLADAFAVAYARYEDFKQLEVAKARVERTLSDLKATQTQLIHAEKMASLGQMTAGIAHEIKNPLNFVNNFAELNEELADEIFDDLTDNLDLRVTDIKDVLDDMKQNAAHIARHGRRADDIVRTMMQHARGGNEEHTPVAINALVEEYTNLAYHGMRASRPGFAVEVERAYGEAVGQVTVQGQDLGRVLLNLLGNAFDAVQDQPTPTVQVSTRQTEEQVEIRIADNGPGIPEKIREKIFEPFFTTKPTGSGTGLGLSLSYDIITQGHGGTLTVESAEGQGATFIVTLPAHP